MTLTWAPGLGGSPGSPGSPGSHGSHGSPARAGRDAARWAASLALVLAVHGALVAALLARRQPIEPAVPPPPAVLIELAPLPAPAPAVEPPTPLPPPAKRAISEPLPSPAPKPAVVLPPPKPKTVRPPPPTLAPEPTPAPTPPPAAAPPRQPPMAPSALPAPTHPAVSPSYEGLLMSVLERNKRYPRTARMRHEQGTAVLRFTLARDGRLLAFKLERSSGIAALDDEVLAMIQRVAPLPPFPPEMHEPTLELVIPVSFTLR